MNDQKEELNPINKLPHGTNLTSGDIFDVGIDCVTKHVGDRVYGLQEGNGGLIVNQRFDDLLEESKEILGPNYVHKRVYLLRHFPYIDDPQGYYRRYKQLLLKKLSGVERISDNEIIELNDLEGKIQTYESIQDIPESFGLRNLFDAIRNELTLGNALFYYDKSGKERIKVCAKDLIDKFPNLESKVRDAQLGGSKKSKTIGRIDDDLVREFGDFYDNEIIKCVEDDNVGTVVILSNRSYSHAFSLRTGDVRLKRKSVSDCEEIFENKGYLFSDYTLERNVGDNERLVLSQNIPQILYITPSNSSELISIIFQQELIGVVIPKNLAWIQNIVNTHFIKNPQLYRKYLTSTHPDLRTFCLANLFVSKKEEDIDFIDQTYRKRAVKLTEAEEKLFMEHFSHQKIENLVTHLFDCGFLSKNGDNNNIKARSNIALLRKRSLDQDINTGKPESVLPRELFWVETQENDVRDKDGVIHKEKQYFQHQSSFEDIVSGTKFPGKKSFVLPAVVGSGKSIWMTDFMQHVVENHPEKTVVFFEGSQFRNNAEGLIASLRSQVNHPSGNNVICIDAIDEAPAEARAEIKQIIASNTKNLVVATARPTEYNENENDSVVTLGFKPISKDVFLQSRIKDEEKRKEIEEKLKSSNLAHEVEGNPLLLNFICLLAKDEEEKKLQEIRKTCGVKTLDQINNKADLYENIAKLVIIQHYYQKHKIVNKRYIEQDLLELGNCAYKLFTKSEAQINYDSDYFKRLALFFKKANTSDVEKPQYEFIHYSFFEYFLARHLALHPDMQQPSKIQDEKTGELLYPGFDQGAEAIFQVRDTNFENWNEWRRFKPTTLFYGQILGNIAAEGKESQDPKQQKQSEECLAKLEKFLGEDGILRNDDIFGEGFFIGLGIIGNGLICKSEILAYYCYRVLQLDDFHFLTYQHIVDDLLNNPSFILSKEFLNTLIDRYRSQKSSFDSFGKDSFYNKTFRIPVLAKILRCEGIISGKILDNRIQGINRAIAYKIKTLYEGGCEVLSDDDYCDFPRLFRDIRIYNRNQQDFIINYVKSIFAERQYCVGMGILYDLAHSRDKQTTSFVISFVEHLIMLISTDNGIDKYLKSYTIGESKNGVKIRDIIRGLKRCAPNDLISSVNKLIGMYNEMFNDNIENLVTKEKDVDLGILRWTEEGSIDIINRFAITDELGLNWGLRILFDWYKINVDRNVDLSEELELKLVDKLGFLKKKWFGRHSGDYTLYAAMATSRNYRIGQRLIDEILKRWGQLKEDVVAGNEVIQEDVVYLIQMIAGLSHSQDVFCQRLVFDIGKELIGLGYIKHGAVFDNLLITINDIQELGEVINFMVQENMCTTQDFKLFSLRRLIYDKIVCQRYVTQIVWCLKKVAQNSQARFYRSDIQNYLTKLYDHGVYISI